MGGATGRTPPIPRSALDKNHHGVRSKAVFWAPRAWFCQTAHPHPGKPGHRAHMLVCCVCVSRQECWSGLPRAGRRKNTHLTQREEGWPGDGKHRPQGQDGERWRTEDEIPPCHPRGPPAVRSETIPNPQHPRGNNTQRPLAVRGSSQRGDRPQRPGRPGESLRPHVPFSPLAGSVPLATEAGDTVSSLRGTEGPEAL